MQKKTEQEQHDDRWSLDVLDVAFLLAAALLAGFVSVVTRFITSFDTFDKDPPPLHALGPIIVAGAATGPWIRRKLLRRQARPPRPASRLGTVATALTIAGIVGWFAGMVRFFTYYRAYLRDLSGSVWTMPVFLATLGTVLLVVGRVMDSRLRKTTKLGRGSD